MKNKNTFLGLIIVIILVLGTIYTFFIRPSYYRFNGGEADLRPTYSEHLSDDFVNMLAVNGYLYECNKNGLIKKEADGTVVWTKSYYMEFPLLVNQGSYFAVAEITGKKIMVFNEQGHLYDVDVSYPILDAYINEGGFLSVIEEDNEQNYIHYFNSKGEGVVDKATVFIKDGFPIDHVTSSDVKKMVTGYLNVNDNKLDTVISFFSFDDKYEDREFLMGGLKYENSLLDEIHWLDDQLLMVVMDNLIAINRFDEAVDEVAIIDVKSKIKKVVVSTESFIVWYGDAIEQSETMVAHGVAVYDFDGNLVNAHEFDERILGVYESDEGFFVVTASRIIYYKDKNREWFASTYLTIEGLYYIDQKHFVALTGSGYELLEMRSR